MTLENTFHKGLLVGSDSRKNLSMVLLVPCMDFHGLVVSRDTTLYGFSWSSGRKASAHWTERPKISAT